MVHRNTHGRLQGRLGQLEFHKKESIESLLFKDRVCVSVEWRNSTTWRVLVLCEQGSQE